MSGDPPGDRRIVLCRALIGMRSVVGEVLGFALCPNPVWDMLLELYAAQHEGRDVYLWPLCMASNAPLSTAHRKVADLEADGLLVRHLSITDRRRIRVRLTPGGSDLVCRLLDRLDVHFRTGED